ncbi:MAG: hypothetical protein FWF54_00315 [Candidatus Azobacteroides sp.]|nr:hypothetical protein [Candidatus Azobacteroides sp.]
MTDRYINKQTILSRMRRLAADYFGVSRTELLDPVVNLFLESLGEEIYRIAGDIDNMETRILDKLSAMLVSDMELVTEPAHGIMHASASEGRQILTPETVFRCRYNVDETNLDLNFYPVCNTLVYHGDVRYFIYDGLFYSMDKERNKTLLSRARQKEAFAENSFWIGLEPGDNVNDLENLSFYIDFDGIYNKDVYIRQIPYLVWENASGRIPMQRGMPVFEDKKRGGTLDLFDAFDVSNRINDGIKKEYDPYFLSVKGRFDISNSRELFPAKLAGSFSDIFKDDFSDPLIWIEITCPPQYTNDIINSLQISINTLPVVCKKLVNRTLEINKEMPVIPLYTDHNESFLSVHSLLDSTGKEYYDIPVNDEGGNHYGIYSLRRGGCERYNVRDAGEYLSRTADVLDREASALFRGNKELKEIQSDVYAVVRNLKQVIKNETERFEPENYILVDTGGTDEIYFVKYWVADYVSGYRIRPGVRLELEPGLPVNPDSVFLLTTIKDGRYAPRQSGRSDIFRKSLTKHPLLVTDEDIIKFCKKEFEGLIREVSVSKGFVEGNDPGVGFVGTTDVYIVPEKKSGKPVGDEDSEYFRQVLAENSPATFNYRVFIDKKCN